VNELVNYLEPCFTKSTANILNTVGERVTPYSEVSDIRDFDIFLMVIPDDLGIGIEICRRFYMLYSHSTLNICELGVLKTGNTKSDAFHALKYVYETIRRNTSKPLVIIGRQFMDYSGFTTFHSPDKSQISLITNAINKNIVAFTKEYHGDVNAIGVQLYLSDPKSIDEFVKYNGESIRLGALAEKIHIAELYLRDSTEVVFDCLSIEKSAGFHVSSGSANGISFQNFCQLAYYAGRAQNANFCFLETLLLCQCFLL